MTPKKFGIVLAAFGLLVMVPSSALAAHPTIGKAKQLKLDMVPAYPKCTAGNAYHRDPIGTLASVVAGAPEACSSPSPLSPQRFQVKNGKQKGSAFSQILVKKGDVQTQFKATGVEDPTGAFGPPGPYNGPGGPGIAGIRITDGDCVTSLPRPSASTAGDTDCTVKDIPFPINPPPDACQNGKCKVKITANEQIAGSVRAGGQSVIAIGYPVSGPAPADGPVQIRDEAGNTALVAGIFVP